MFEDAEMSYSKAWVDVFYSEVGHCGTDGWFVRTARCHTVELGHTAHNLLNPAMYQFDPAYYVEEDGGVWARLRRVRDDGHVQSRSQSGTKWLRLLVGFGGAPSGYLFLLMKA
jgi:hypothetical protein